MSNLKQEDYAPMIGEDHLQYITDTIPPKKRVVVTAANQLTDGTVVLGIRHCCPLMHKTMTCIEPDHTKWLSLGYGKEQGFVDQYGQYLTREEAKRIAIKNNQPLIGEDWGDKLYSENLH